MKAVLKNIIQTKRHLMFFIAVWIIIGSGYILFDITMNQYEDTYQASQFSALTNMNTVILIMLIVLGLLVLAYSWHITFSPLSYRGIRRRNFENYFNEFARNANDIIILHSLKGNIISVNEKAYRVYNYTKEEFKARNISDLLPQSNIKERITEIIAKQGSLFETTHIKKDGTKFPVEVSSRLVGKIEDDLVQSIVRDISKRKRQKRLSHNLNRALKLISKCNHILIKATDRNELEKDICNLIVAMGGYEFAWIGHLDEVNPSQIVPGGHAGNNSDYSAILNPEYLNSISMNNPIKKVFSTGQYVLINNETNDDNFAVWYEKMTKRGYHSSITLPLENINGLFGILSIYSKEINSFVSQDEIDVIEELAGDLAFGLSNLKAIDEKRKIQEELKYSENKYRKLFESELTGNYVSTPEGKIIMCNKKLAEMLGYNNPTELKSINASLLYPEPELRKNFIAAIKERRKILFREGSFVQKDGSVRTVLENGIGEFDENGELVEIIGYMIDITDKKEIEKELSISEERFRSVAESANDAIISADHEGRIIFWNNSAERIFGYSENEVLNKSITFLIPERFHNMHSHGWKNSINNRKIKFGGNPIEIFAIRKNGTEFPIELTLSMWNMNNEVYLTSIIRDITERKMVEASLIEAKEEAEKSNRLKDEFLAQMSHEIRTPINAIINFSTFLKDELNNQIEPELLSCFDSVKSASNRVVSTVEAMLNMADLNTGGYQYSPEQTNLTTEILAPTFTSFKEWAANKKLNFSLTNNEKRSIVSVDKYSVKLIIQNLVENAIKYTKEGDVALRIFRCTEDDKLKVEIEDTGIGISEEYLAKLFTPFSQEKQGYSRPYDGNGLGLALVKEFCNLNNIEIVVNSIKGVGSKFTLTFPG